MIIHQSTDVLSISDDGSDVEIIDHQPVFINNTGCPIYQEAELKDNGQQFINFLNSLYKSKKRKISFSQFSLFDSLDFSPELLHGGLLVFSDMLKTIPINFTKNKKISKHFTFLSNKPRYNRMITNCWIANNCQHIPFEYSATTPNPDHFSSFFLTNNFGLQDTSLLLPENFISFDLKRTSKKNGNYYVYGDNFTNFSFLRTKFYSESVLSLVCEPAFFEPGFMFTEKTVQAYISGHFVIWPGGYKSEACASKFGFETFNDIIDHSYQFIKCPIERTVAALNMNRRIIFDLEYQKELYFKNYEKLMHNASLVQDHKKLTEVAKNFG